MVSGRTLRYSGRLSVPLTMTLNCLHMEPVILLEKLRSLLASAPPLEGRGLYGQEQFAWLGKASALISSWNRTEAIAFGVAVNSMAGNFNCQANFGAVFTSIHKAISSLEEMLPAPTGQAFGPSAAYDFFKALRELMASVERTLFVVDPYLDAETFDGYLGSLPVGRNVRLLFAKYANDVNVASKKYHLQYGSVLEARKSDAIHDRVIFVDGTQCWVLGASIKDAAAKKPTYLAPLSIDVAGKKLKIYEGIWHAATSI